MNSKIKVGSLIHGGAQERGFRGGTENVYGIVGLAKAMDLAYEDVRGHQDHVQGLLQALEIFFPGRIHFLNACLPRYCICYCFAGIWEVAKPLLMIWDDFFIILYGSPRQQPAPTHFKNAVWKGIPSLQIANHKTHIFGAGRSFWSCVFFVNGQISGCDPVGSREIWSHDRVGC